MATQRTLSAIAMAIVTAAGVVLASFFGEEFVTHTKELIRFSGQQKAPVLSTDANLNLHLSPYLDNPNYSVSLVTGAAWSLEKSDIPKTLTRIGNSPPAEGKGWKGDVSIVEAYRSFLDDRLYSLGLALKSEAKPGWQAAFGILQSELGRDEIANRAGALEQAEKHLAQFAWRDEIQEARSLMVAYSAFAPLPEESFEILPDPDELQFRYLGLRARVPVPRMKQAQTETYAAYAISGGNALGNVQVSTTPIYFDVKLVRRWMKSPLLDQQEKLSVPLRVKYFGAKGTLRLVPEFIVLEVGKDIVFQLDDSVSSNRILELLEQAECCILKSDTNYLIVHPDSILPVGNRSIRGRTPPATPVLRAVISRKRTSHA